LVSMFLSGEADPPLSCLGVCFTEICDADGCSISRARRFSPRFGLRVVSLSANVCMLPFMLFLVCFVNLKCMKGFGFAPSVLLVSMFFSR
jgi:hypothetical protein